MCRVKGVLIGLLCPICCAQALNTSHVDNATYLQADKFELHFERSIRLLGHAQISQNNRVITADSIVYYSRDTLLEASGDVRIINANAEVRGPALQLQMTDNIGEMPQASMTIRNITRQDRANSELSLHAQYSTTLDLRGSADKLLFTGLDTKQLEEARLTSCKLDVDDWYISARRIKLDDAAQSAVLHDAKVTFKDVPILYTPWLEFSYSNDRKSGLLAPVFSSTNKNGFDLTTPFYWNIAPNQDATIATRVMSTRGVQLQADYRYLENNFFGTDHVEFLSNDNVTHQDRYYINLKHNHDFGNGWSADYGMEKVSDNTYFSDLSTRIVSTSQVNLPRQLGLNYAGESWTFNGIIQRYQTLDNASYVYQRLPQLTLNGGHTLGGLDTHLYTQMTVFNSSGNNVLSSQRTDGSRFILYPSISLPMNSSFVYATPKFGVHYTQYQLDNVAENLKTQERILPISSLDTGIYLDRTLNLTNNRSYTQTLEPRLFYVYIPRKEQNNLPVFDTSLADLNFTSLFRENQFSGHDRINHANQISLSLTSRLIDNEKGIQHLSASIGQRYYFSELSTTLPNSPVGTGSKSDMITGLSANLRNHWDVDAFWQFSAENGRSTRTTLKGKYAPELGKVFNFGYSYQQGILNQINLASQWLLGKGWHGVGRINYSLQDGRMIEGVMGVEYNAGCWQTRAVVQRVITATADATYALFFQLELGGIASIGANPINVIKRNVAGYTRSTFTNETNANTDTNYVQ